MKHPIPAAEATAATKKWQKAKQKDALNPHAPEKVSKLQGPGVEVSPPGTPIAMIRFPSVGVPPELAKSQMANADSPPVRKPPKWAERTKAKTAARQAEFVPGAGSPPVPLKKVCALAGIEAKDARKILRAKGKRPGGRWEWPESEYKAIVELLIAEVANANKP